MIVINSNIEDAISLMVNKLDLVRDTDKLLRECATTVLALIKIRIHKDGQDINGRQIGVYSRGYMKVRTGDYKNSKRTKKGVLKDAGVFTKRGTTIFTQEDEETVSSRKGFVKTEFEKKARPRYNRTKDTKVIISLTRQLENDESVFPTPRGYGIGFNNRHNFDKSQWVEAIYNLKGQIFNISTGELNIVIAIAEQHVKDAIS